MVALLREHDEGELEPVDWERIWDKVHETTIGTARVRRMKWMRVAAAAVIVVIGTGAYFFSQPEKQQPNQKIASTEAHNVQQDVLPGGNKAILTLAGGEQIILDSVANGVLAQQGNANVVKLANGQLAYKGTGAKADEIIYNTLGTPRGGQYRLMLPDGSKVWLNAASSLHFPTAFNGNERNVGLTGEAYFEVQKNRDKPFHVQVNDMKIEVLGTHFNVKAYDEEDAVKTTLLEGSVRIAKAGVVQTTLVPGQQAHLKKNGNLKVMNNINMEEAIAWKKGELILNNVNMDEAARIIARWYNVSFVFQNSRLKKCRFSISFLKGETIEQAMELISLYNEFDYHIENRKITLTGKGCQ